MRWVPVTERLPPAGRPSCMEGPYIVWAQPWSNLSEYGWHPAWWLSEEGWRLDEIGSDAGSYPPHTVTHWLEILSPEQDESDHKEEIDQMFWNLTDVPE